MERENLLIYANALIERCKEIAGYEWNRKASPVSWTDAYEQFADDVEGEPTVDAVEVVHAHWEDGCAVDPKTGRIIYKSIDCSNCEEIFKIESHDREYWKERFKVCPFCGAVMDGGNEDG